MFERCSGILLHPTSLPSKYGIGELGDEAFKFVDFLINSGQKLWQIFPLGPTGYGDSPYQCFSAFAGNPLLISLSELKKIGLLSSEDLNHGEDFDSAKIDYGRVLNFKMELLKKAYENFKAKDDFLLNNKFKRFCNENTEWLDDYSLFRAVKTHFGDKCWCDWDDKEIILREEEAIERYSEMLADSVKFRKFIQFTFFQQWSAIKSYANGNGIKIVGDIPIFISYDSSDAWANPELFLFDEDRKPVKVAGVPPDYFSETGQLWGNPIYNWDAMKKTKFSWWIERIKANLVTADIIRVDHFRGFAQYWGVDAHEETAINGKWYDSPGQELFDAIREELGRLPIIAEDLGLITQDVIELRDHFELPGMKILQFGFDESLDSEHIPHKTIKNSVIYTGTHDNDTIKGWYDTINDKEKEIVNDYLRIRNAKNISWEFIQAAFSSVADIAIVPLQDVLSVGSEGRMNTPGLASGNWQWRYESEYLTDDIIVNLEKLTKLYSR